MIKWINDYFENRRLKAIAADREYHEKYIIEKRKANEERINRNISFFKRPCPINDGKDCFEDCIHFQPSYVIDWSDEEEFYVKFYVYEPKCKLWGN